MCTLSNKIEESYIGYSIQYKQITGSILPESERFFLEFNKITTREESDHFFSLYGVGNIRIGYDRPFERHNVICNNLITPISKTTKVVYLILILYYSIKFDL